MFIRTDFKGRRVYRSRGTLYLWHKDNVASINPEDVDEGSMMYISVYNDTVVDGYNGRVGKPEDFQVKLEVIYEWTVPSTSEEFRYINENGEEDYCEAMWVEITHIIKHTCKTPLEHLESVLEEETGLRAFIMMESDEVLRIYAKNDGRLDFEMSERVSEIIKNSLNFQLHQPFCLNKVGTVESVYTSLPCEIILSIDAW